MRLRFHSEGQRPPRGGGDLGAAAARFLRPAIAHIVGSHARSQSIKGILTAGPVKATAYAAAKIKKWVRAVLGVRL